MFPLLPWEAEMLNPLWLIIFGLCGRKSGDGITLVCGIWQNETVWFTCERVLHTLQGDTECHVAGLEVPVRPFPLPTFLKSRRQSPSLVFPMAPMSLAVFFFFCEWNADEFPVLPTGVREEAMGWTMTLKDDFGVIAWTRRGAANNLSLFLLLSLFSFSVQSDIVFPRDRHFSWKAGKMSVALHRCECVNQCPFLTFQIETPR